MVEKVLPGLIRKKRRFENQEDKVLTNVSSHNIFSNNFFPILSNNFFKEVFEIASNFGCEMPFYLTNFRGRF